LIVVIALAALFWYLADRQPPPAQNDSAPTATNTAEIAVTTTAEKDETPPSPAAREESEAVELAAPAAAVVATAAPTDTPDTAMPTAAPTRGPPDRIDGLPVITLEELPPEALETLALIASDGPFPFRQDGTTFQNRERILPRKPTGYYREYTVVTPGASTRGARRIVAGAAGELYYTDDHYASFSRIWTP
jgi:guanyl-specific ribonuclease Sa